MNIQLIKIPACCYYNSNLTGTEISMKIVIHTGFLYFCANLYCRVLSEIISIEKNI